MDPTKVQSSQANSGCMLSGARRVHPVIVGWSTANRPLLSKPIMASGNSPEKLGRSGVAGGHAWRYGLNHYAPNRHDTGVDHPTISARSCANSGRYKPVSSRRRPEKRAHRRRDPGIWTNLFGGSKKSSEENSEK
jgi:hypothetical protein